MDRTTKETRRQSYDAVLPKREKRCRLILETVGRRKATRSDATEAVWARAQPAADADKLAAVPADNPAAGPEQMTLLGPGA